MNKLIPLTLALTCLSFHKHHSMTRQDFIAERVSKTSSFIAEGPIDKVFLLFGAFEEKKWTEGWDPVPVYPLSATMEEGMIFRTAGHVHGEVENTWIVSQYQPLNHRVQYAVIAPGRLLTITVICTAVSAARTSATVTYTFTGLTEEGNVLSKHLIARMYKRDLKDWEEAINYYLRTGEQLRGQK